MVRSCYCCITLGALSYFNGVSSSLFAAKRSVNMGFSRVWVATTTAMVAVLYLLAHSISSAGAFHTMPPALRPGRYVSKETVALSVMSHPHHTNSIHTVSCRCPNGYRESHWRHCRHLTLLLLLCTLRRRGLRRYHHQQRLGPAHLSREAGPPVPRLLFDERYGEGDEGDPAARFAWVTLEGTRGGPWGREHWRRW